MAWIIDRDYIAGEGETQRVGTGQWGDESKWVDDEQPDTDDCPFRFRLLDDDGEIYYGGRYDQAAMDNDDEWGGLYQALKWAEADAGATTLQVKAADWGGTHAADNADKEGWYIPYG